MVDGVRRPEPADAMAGAVEPVVTKILTDHEDHDRGEQSFEGRDRDRTRKREFEDIDELRHGRSPVFVRRGTEKQCAIGRQPVTGGGLRLAGFRPRLAEFYEPLADSGIGDAISAQPRWERRYSVGVSPVSALNARLNGLIEPNPASSAIVSTGTST